MLWLQVRRGKFAPEEARTALLLLRALVPPTPTDAMNLHETALEIGIAAGHSPYDTLYLAFALAMGATRVVVADRGFVSHLQRQPDRALAGMLTSPDDWEEGQA